MQVKAKENLIYGGEIYSRGKIFECEEKILPSMEARGLIEVEEVDALPSLAEVLRKKSNAKTSVTLDLKTDSIGVE